MKSGLIKIPIKDMSRVEWLKERNKGLGGSDVGAIFGVDRYKPGIKLFHQKTGIWDTDEEDNIAAYGGRVGEEFIYHNYWKYWDPDNNDTDIMLANANEDRVVRSARNVNSMIVNPEYPWLRANIDKEINKYKGKPTSLLELKKPSSMHWNTYEAGIPPGAVLQVQTYMLICGYDYAELFALKDGTYPEMFQFEKSETIQAAIIERTEDFWNRVVQARDIWGDKKLSIEEKMLAIAPLEPEITREEAKGAEEYMKERYKAGTFDDSIIATEEVENWREKYWRSHVRMKRFEGFKLYYKALLLNFMSQNTVNAVIMSDEKQITLLKGKLTVPKIKK